MRVALATDNWHRRGRRCRCRCRGWGWRWRWRLAIGVKRRFIALLETLLGRQHPGLHAGFFLGAPRSASGSVAAVLVQRVSHQGRLQLRRGLQAGTGRRSQHGHKSADDTEKTVELKLSHKALSVEKTSKNPTGGWRAAHQNLISEISAWQYAPATTLAKSARHAGSRENYSGDKKSFFRASST